MNYIRLYPYSALLAALTAQVATKADAAATTAALAGKAPLASPTFTGTVSGVTKAHVGLGNVDNTTDANKPVSTATQAALDAAAASVDALSDSVDSLASTSASLASGLSGVQTEIGNARNGEATLDAMIDKLAPLASPAFTGTPTGITKAHVGLGNVDNTTDANKPISTSAQTALNVHTTQIAAIASGLDAAGDQIGDLGGEIFAARGGQVNLDTRLDIQQTQIEAVATGVDAAGEQLIALGTEVGDARGGFLSVDARLDRDEAALLAAGDGMRSYYQTAGVALGGGIQTTFNAFPFDRDPRLRTLIRVAPGTFTEITILGRGYVDLAGAGAARTLISGLQADNSSLANIADRSGLEWYYNADVAGVGVTVRNARYAIHSDQPTPPPGIVQRLTDCAFVHLGNAGAVAWQGANGGNPGGVWSSTAAWGIGLGSGQRISSERCEFRGDYAGIIVHNNDGFTDPARLTIRDCSVSGLYSMQALAMGSGREDRVELLDSALSGDILYLTLPWKPATLAYQPADHSEIKIVGDKLGEALFLMAEFGRALRIVATSPTATIAITGTAAPILFGTALITDPVGNLPASATGTFDVSDTAVGPNSDVVITKLGLRLGNRTSSPVALTVTVSGSSPVTITFNTNYSTMENEDVLAIINTALGATATASLFNAGGRYRPEFRQEERRMLNAGVDGLPFRSVLAFDGSADRVRLMTSADAASLYAGVAWEDIYPGKRGRVRTAGWAGLADDLLRTDSAGGDTFGATFSVDAAAPGKIARGGSQALLRIVRIGNSMPTAVRVG